VVGRRGQKAGLARPPVWPWRSAGPASRPARVTVATVTRGAPAVSRTTSVSCPVFADGSWRGAQGLGERVGQFDPVGRTPCRATGAMGPDTLPLTGSRHRRTQAVTGPHVRCRDG
jgi:hypothetical protein